MGAKAGKPDSVVWAIDGDGCFQMTNQELATCAIEGIPVKIAVINNGNLGMVRQWQEMFFNNRYSEVDLAASPDFVKLAEAYGVKAWRIRRSADVDRILQKAHDYDGGPCVVVAEVVKEDNVFPMIPAGAAVSEMIIEPPKHKLAKPTGST
jgi:acetolactate synthase-1/2/3 large subunit